MAIQKIEIRPKGTGDYADVLYPRTSVDMVDGALANTDYVRTAGYGATTGGANTYTLTLAPALAAYTDGVAISIKINAANTGASTINVNGLGAKSILKANGSAVTSGNLKLNSVYTLRYNGTSFILQGEGGGGTATAVDIANGKTATTDVGDVVGTAVVASYKVTSPVDIISLLTNASSSASSVPKKVREIQMELTGTVRVRWKLRCQNTAETSRGQIYVNGVALGVQRSTNATTDTTYTEDIVINPNDLLQLYLWTAGGVYNAYSAEMTIQYDRIPSQVVLMGS